MSTREHVLAALLLLALTAACYWPGLSGPWLFDDYPNILDNAAVRVDALDAATLAQSAWLGQAAGPLGRPLAYLSFALNHYWAGGTVSAFPFKLTNLVIHLTNVGLVWLLAGAIARRLPRPPSAPLFALVAAALFALHPIMLSSVLYVVQRMTSLATTFSLAALLCWLRARGSPQEAPTRPWAAAGWLLAAGGFFVLGIFSKENAVLVLPLAVLLDAALFVSAWPWCLWDRLAPATRRVMGGVAVGLAAVAFGLAAQHFAGGYGAREFTLSERLLTEPRVLWFYLGLLLFPRINAFGLHHDDIALTTGWLAPWTTLPALLGLLLATGVGLWALRRRPLLAIGVLWFLIGHSLEGSFIPLEIAHEHRNYLPALGPMLLLAGGFCRLWERLPRRQVVMLAGTVLLLLAGTTALRASQWRDDLTFSRYEVAHHPRSSRARNDLASDLARAGDLAAARAQAEEAVRLEPNEFGNRVNLANLVLAQGDALDAQTLTSIEALLRERPLSAFGTLTLKRYAECIEGKCRHMAPYLARWLDVYLASGQPTFEQSYAWYLKGLSLRAAGDVGGSLNAFEKAFAADTGFLHPLFEQANIFLALGQWDNAEFNLRRLRAANQRAPVRQERAIAELAAAIDKGKRGQ